MLANTIIKGGVMRKIAEKVALVAQICVAVVFVIVATLYAFGLTTSMELQSNVVTVVVMIVLAVVFAGTSIYLLYVSFSESQNVKRMLLYADSKCATATTLKVVNKIAGNCADKIDGVHIKRTKIRADEKKGYVATFAVQISATSVTPALEQLRCLIEDSFKNTLGLTFNTITFEVDKLTSQPTTNVAQAKKRAQAITESADQVQDAYENPTGEQPCDKKLPLATVQPTDEPADENEVATDGQFANETDTDITEQSADTTDSTEEPVDTTPTDTDEQTDGK